MGTLINFCKGTDMSKRRFDETYGRDYNALNNLLDSEFQLGVHAARRHLRERCLDDNAMIEKLFDETLSRFSKTGSPEINNFLFHLKMDFNRDIALAIFSTFGVLLSGEISSEKCLEEESLEWEDS